jgi:hypothetical protein
MWRAYGRGGLHDGHRGKNDVPSALHDFNSNRIAQGTDYGLRMRQSHATLQPRASAGRGRRFTHIAWFGAVAPRLWQGAPVRHRLILAPA